MSTQKDTTVRATYRRLLELGYAPTSLTNPDRIVQPGQGPYNRASIHDIGDHQAAVLCFPTADNAHLPAEGDDGSARRVIDLTVTAYLQSDKRALAACMPVLDRYGLTCGPNYVDGFGNRHFIIQWHGDRPIYGKHRTRLCFEADDHIVCLSQAIEPRRDAVRNALGGFTHMAVEPIGSYVIAVGSEWKGGHILDTPHKKLPELSQADASRLIDDLECARWGARPAAAARDAA